MVQNSAVIRKYSMVSVVALLTVAGSVNAATMDAYGAALASGNTKASAVEAMELVRDQINAGGNVAESVMKTSEELMSGVVATGDEQSVKWVSAAILKGAGKEYFNAAELGIRVVLEGTRYQPKVAQITDEARQVMGITTEAAVAEAAPEAKEKSFASDMFNINRSSFAMSNRLSVGYDSNIYSSTSEDSGPVVRDALTISLRGSTPRTSGQVFYKPTFTWSPEKDTGDTELYQDFVGLLSHELSERNIIRLKDTFRLQEDEDLVTTGDDVDNSYWRNTTELGFDRVMNDESRLSLNGTAEFKRYSESDQDGKDYDLWSVGTAYSRDLSETTFMKVSASFTDVDYNNDFASEYITLFAGLNHQLNSDLLLEGYAGVQMVDPDAPAGVDVDDKTSPYFDGKITYYFSPDTSVSGLVSYKYDPNTSRDDTVGVDKLSYAIAMRHALTAKIRLDAKVGISTDEYDSDISSRTSDFETNYTDFSTRATYTINRTHSVDLGYKFRNTDSDLADEYERHQIDAGWTVKF